MESGSLRGSDVLTFPGSDHGAHVHYSFVRRGSFLKFEVVERQLKKCREEYRDTMVKGRERDCLVRM